MKRAGRPCAALALALATIVVGLVLLIGAGSATAQEPTPPTPTTTTTTVPEEIEASNLGESLVPDSGAGPYPAANYDIGFDEGAWNSFSRKVFGFFTGLGWTVNRWIVSVVLWLTGWAFGFDVLGPLEGPILDVANAFQTNLVGPLRLDHFVWFAVMSYAAFQFFRGRAMSALGETALSLTALTVATVLATNPAGYIDGATDMLRYTSGAVLAVARGEPPSGDPSQAAQIVEPMRAELFDVLIVKPHEIINWGRPLSGECATVAEQNVAEGPWGTDDEPRNRMRDAGCQREYDFNERPNWERLMSAWMAAAVSVCVLVLLAMAVVTMLVGSLMFIIRFAWIYLALVAFQLPGIGRELGWSWLVGLLRDFCTVVAMTFVIAMMLLTSQAFLVNPDLQLSERFALLVVLAVAMIMWRKKLITGVHTLMSRISGELSSFRPGAAGSRMGAMAAGGAIGAAAGITGYGIAQRARDAAREDIANPVRAAGKAASSPVRGVRHVRQAVGGKTPMLRGGGSSARAR